ncbi:MAG: hypothetical protein COU06_01975 [Candidatus Harrisonbacteria bacterium CG10_big_fil_rev_8_21_14_0_10_38_8]|uniref:Non-canonical purine NTP pyrophosphatase n=1 Tax=Candidatus Harrisonbacteria bacterium CG10_big_fil_rev_8_21_14_0_10_38_8 TaxID=1974582 RepID=A0A2M6WJY0_9BACT|nr:MAG: hypothetical protein COU06_01975 [Candidatus Harrisonbacteria bacterium CG10_big_fil_rev_8_21_14_0_10_38_8]
MIKDIIFVTSNKDKFREASEVLGYELKRKAVDIEEIQDLDVIKVAKAKAKQAYEVLKKPVIVEDSALYVSVWSGFPGPFIKWIDKGIGYDEFAKLIPKNNRRAQWWVVYVFYNGKEFRSFVGKTKGSISLKPKGKSWGFDSIFIIEGIKKTMAELTSKEKSRLGSRGRALVKLRRFLNTLV